MPCEALPRPWGLIQQLLVSTRVLPLLQEPVHLSLSEFNPTQATCVNLHFLAQAFGNTPLQTHSCPSHKLSKGVTGRDLGADAFGEAVQYILLLAF